MVKHRSRIFVLLHTPILQLLADPRKKLREIMPELRQLREFLKGAASQPEPLHRLVEFFGRISPWHDRGLEDVISPFRLVNYGQYDHVIVELIKLEVHFVNAGRDQFGMNRTERGERVTADKVYVGGVFGLFTHAVPFWVARCGEPKGAHPDYPDMNGYDLVAWHANRFMRSHGGLMIQLIAELEAVCEERDRRAA